MKYKIYKYDVFLSYAFKDAKKYVKKLQKELNKLNIKVFYDELVVTIGDNLETMLEDALGKSMLAVIVFSKTYNKTEWTQREFIRLAKKQNNEKEKSILPILYKISKEDFVKGFPDLRNIHYKYAKSMTTKRMANLIKHEVDKKIAILTHSK